MYPSEGIRDSLLRNYLYQRLIQDINKGSSKESAKLFDFGKLKTSGSAFASQSKSLAPTKPNLLDMNCKEHNPQHWQLHQYPS